MDKEPLSGQNLVKVRSITAIVTISCVKFCPDKDFLFAIYCSVIKYLHYSSAGICSQVRRASLERELHERRPFYTKRNGGPDGKHNRLVSSWQVAFKSKPFPALPRCPSNKINTSFQSKEAPSSWNLTHRFHLWFFLYIINIDANLNQNWSKIQSQIEVLI